MTRELITRKNMDQYFKKCYLCQSYEMVLKSYEIKKEYFLNAGIDRSVLPVNQHEIKIILMEI